MEETTKLRMKYNFFLGCSNHENNTTRTYTTSMNFCLLIIKKNFGIFNPGVGKGVKFILIQFFMEYVKKLKIGGKKIKTTGENGGKK